MYCEEIDDEVFQSAIRRIPASARRNSWITSALYDIRDDLNNTLRGCADNVTVEVHMDDYLYEPITIQSGSGGNKLAVHISEWGNVQYRWIRQTWARHFRNAYETVRSIARKIVSSVGSFFGRLFGSNKSIEGPSRGYLTYY
ncbi:uncharacterized protein LOC134258678 [Saccostrea cucullata]|uniref:uncharacterized protein LOC134258678 n=1 Tax=Saccostrea cuccullata TaxID=36930 RepID=UPI002ED3FC96